MLPKTKTIKAALVAAEEQLERYYSKHYNKAEERDKDIKHQLEIINTINKVLHTKRPCVNNLSKYENQVRYVSKWMI